MHYFLLSLMLAGSLNYVEPDKEGFLNALNKECFWCETMTCILDAKPEYWKARFKRAQTADYTPASGRSLYLHDRKDLKRIKELASQYGVDL